MSGLARTILLVVLILLIVGLLPTWGYMGGVWYPSGGAGLVLLIVIILLVLGRI